MKSAEELLIQIGDLVEREAPDSEWRSFIIMLQADANARDVFDDGTILKMATLTIQRDEAFGRGQESMRERAAKMAESFDSYGVSSVISQAIRALKPEGK